MVALLPCPPIVGAVVSRTVIVWLTVPLVLPQPSTALQVLVSVKLFAQLPAAVVSLIWFTVAPLQMSEAVGAVKLGVFGHSMVALPPCPPIVGGVVSRTVIAWLTVPLVLPQASTARQLRVVTWAQALPEVVSPRFVTVTEPELSDAVGAVKEGVAGHSRVALAPGEPMVGFVVSPVPRVTGPVSWTQLVLVSLTKIVCVEPGASPG